MSRLALMWERFPQDFLWAMLAVFAWTTLMVSLWIVFDVGCAR